MDTNKLAQMLRQYISDASPGGLLNPEVPPGGPTALAKGLLGFTPGIGDAISGYDAVQSAREGNYGEAGLNALGLLPFVPSMAGITRDKMFADALATVGKGSWTDYFSAIKNKAKEAYKANSEVFDNAHKAENLSFEAVPVNALSDLAGAKRIYKSPSYNGRQSSEYFVGIINGEPAYIRKSNHWGPFSTNIYEGSQEAIKAGLKNDHFDPFGRVGTTRHNWELVGGDSGSAKSQAGFIPLSKLLEGK